MAKQKQENKLLSTSIKVVKAWVAKGVVAMILEFEIDSGLKLILVLWFEIHAAGQCGKAKVKKISYWVQVYEQ